MSNQTLIENFYRAFQAQDGKAMAASYHPQAQFWDPVFQSLEGPAVGTMWIMLCAQAQELKVQLKDLAVDGDQGQATWVAQYRFGRQGREVHNVIGARFQFQDGRILNHRDSFDLWRWSRQALGLSGVLLGWSPWFQRQIQHRAQAGLIRFTQTTKAR